jgi:hypothetical protein
VVEEAGCEREHPRGPGSSPALTLTLPLQLKKEMGNTVMDIIRNYTANATSSREEAWDYVQAQVRMSLSDSDVVCYSWRKDTSALGP